MFGGLRHSKGISVAGEEWMGEKVVGGEAREQLGVSRRVGHRKAFGFNRRKWKASLVFHFVFQQVRFGLGFNRIALTAVCAIDRAERGQN